MRKLNPYPLYWVLKLEKPKQLEALEKYQDVVWGLNLEIPPYPSEMIVQPIKLSTAEAAYLMRQRPRPRRIANL